MSEESYQGEMLRIYLGADDRIAGHPLYEVLLEKAQECDLSGGSIFKGIEGYGAHGEVHSSQILRLSEKLPVTAEFVGRSFKIENFLEKIHGLIEEGLITRTPVQITKLRKT